MLVQDQCPIIMGVLAHTCVSAWEQNCYSTCCLAVSSVELQSCNYSSLVVAVWFICRTCHLRPQHFELVQPICRIAIVIGIESGSVGLLCSSALDSCSDTLLLLNLTVLLKTAIRLSLCCFNYRSRAVIASTGLQPIRYCTARSTTFASV